MANIGITLRSARIQRGLTIEQVAQDTRISARFLEALEAEAFEELPAPVYVRGFLRSYANYLRLDPQPLLEQLQPAFGGGVVPAPSAPAEPRPRRPDPFRPATPMTPPPPPARPRVIGDPDAEDGFGTVGAADPFSARRAESETPLEVAYEPRYRRDRTGGVLMERGAVYDDDGRVARIVALAAGALILLVVFAGVAFALGSGGDDDDDPAQGGLGGNTPGSNVTGTIIVGGTRTPTRATTGTATGATGTPAPTQTPGGPTATPTAESRATVAPTSTTGPPTATQPPPTPTATSVPPTPTPTMVPPPAHGSAFSECPVSGGQPQCNWPAAVVCTPDGDWFVDYGNDFPAAVYGWPSRVANSNGDAVRAGEAGCT